VSVEHVTFCKKSCVILTTLVRAPNSGGVVRQGTLIGGVGSGMGDGSGSEEGGASGAQGDHDTGHVGTGGMVAVVVE